MQTLSNSGNAPGRRRHYSAELKAEVVAVCGRSGQSVAAVAQSHGVCAHRAREWVREAQRRHIVVPMNDESAMPVSGFIPVQLASAQGVANDIRIEMIRRGITVNVSWPCAAASECVVWMRELLR